MVWASKDSVLPVLKENVLEVGNDQTKIGAAIVEFWDERQEILSDEAARHERKEYAEDLAEFLNSQTETITE